MKKVKASLTSAALLATFAFTAGTVNAELLARSPSLTAPGGFPLWYQAQDGLALQPCLDQTTPGNPCGLLSEIGFNAAQPIAFPNNFPSETFYYMAQSDTFPVGAAGATADVLMAIEGGFADSLTGALVLPAAPRATPIAFNRMRVSIDPNNGPNITAGTYTVTHPFGSETFPCDGGNGRCVFTIDIPTANPFNFDSALGVGIPNTMSVFLKQTAPLPATGFIGDSASLGPITGGPVRNTFGVSGPIGSGSTSNFIVTGKTLGLTVDPQVAPDFGVWKFNTPSTPTTFTITNRTGIDIPARNTTVNPPLGVVLTSNSPLFTIPAATDTCAGGLSALPADPTNSCTFEVVFTPILNGVINATLSIASSASPTITIPITGTGDGESPLLTIGPRLFTNTKILPLSATISGTATDNVLVHDILVSLNGVSQGSSTVTNGDWSFVVSGLTRNADNTVSVSAVDTALPAPGNTTTLTKLVTHDDLPPAVSITAPIAGFTKNSNPTLNFTANDALSGVAITNVKLDTNPTPICTANCNNLSLGSPVALPEGQHSVIVEATDAAGNIGSNTTTFTVDTISPAITVSSPAPFNGRLGISNPVLIFSVNDTNQPINTAVTLDAGLVNNSVSGTTTLGPFLSGESHTLTLVSTDPAGNVTTNPVTFVIDFHDGRISSLGVNPPSITDALLALRHAVNLAPLTGEAFSHADVAPLDLATGIPNPNNTVDIADALIILRRVVGLINTF